MLDHKFSQLYSLPRKHTYCNVRIIILDLYCTYDTKTDFLNKLANGLLNLKFLKTGIPCLVNNYKTGSRTIYKYAHKLSVLYILNERKPVIIAIAYVYQGWAIMVWATAANVNKCLMQTKIEHDVNVCFDLPFVMVSFNNRIWVEFTKLRQRVTVKTNISKRYKLWRIQVHIVVKSSWFEWITNHSHQWISAWNIIKLILRTTIFLSLRTLRVKFN